MHVRHLFAKTVVCVGALSLIASCSKTEEPQAQGGSDTSAPAVTTDGTTGSSSPEDAVLAAALTQAGEATQAKNTGKVSGTVEVTIGGAMLSDDPFESDPSAAATEDVTMALSLEGSYDVENQQSDTTVTVDELSGPSDALDGDSGPQAAGDTQQVITDGDVTYTREVSGGEVRLVDGKEWVRGEVEMSSSEPSVPGFSDTGIVDPRQLLAQLEETATEVTDEGTVEIDGVETTHYHAELSMADIAAQSEEDGDTSSTMSDEDLEMLSEFPELEELYQDFTIPVDVYVDADGLVRRYEIDADLGDLMSALFSMMMGVFGSMGEDLDTTGTSFAMPDMDMTYRIKMSVDFTDLGEPVDITIPADDEVAEASDDVGSSSSGGGVFSQGSSDDELYGDSGDVGELDTGNDSGSPSTTASQAN